MSKAPSNWQKDLGDRAQKVWDFAEATCKANRECDEKCPKAKVKAERLAYRIAARAWKKVGAANATGDALAAISMF